MSQVYSTIFFAKNQVLSQNDLNIPAQSAIMNKSYYDSLYHIFYKKV